EKVLNNLLAILEGGPDRKTPGREQANELPVRTRSLIETLLARIPQGNKLADHARLRQLVQESGLFSEQRQAQTASGAEARPTDIKQALVQLARQLAVQKPAAGDPPTTARAPVNAQGQTAAPATAITSTPLSANRGEHGERPAAASQPAVAAPKPVLAAKPDAPQLPVEVSRHLQKSLAPGQQSQTGNQGQLQAVTVQDLQRLVEGAVARIVSQQAQSLPQPGQDAVRWVFELPYRQGDEFHSMPMVIEREASGDDSAELEPGWQVELAFELAELGPIQARVLLRGDKVSASLWAQRDDTAQLADAELPVLEAALEGSGLSVGALVCRQGQHNASQHLVPNSSSSLLDCRI
ncbi:MAG: flagellar hook-length control protein FliK, partial [Porticoccaceae bacterium]|nr:flagellar hook-length control protein FliK [Porticoccaceae bacterium]